MRRCYLPALMMLAACGTKDRDAPSNNAARAPEMATEQPTEAALQPSPPPADFEMPDFAPRYPGSILVSVNSANVGGAQNHEVRLTTSDGAEKVMAFYREKFAAARLRKTSDFFSAGSGMMSGIGKDRKASIVIGREEAHQMVIVTYSGT